MEWLTRVRAYWNRPNAKARDIGRALLGFLGSDGALFPSLASLARAAICSVKTVQRWIQEFVAAGFLERIRRRSPFGQTSNAYRIRFPDPEPPAADPAPPECQLSIYNNQEEEDGARLSMDSLPAGRISRLLGWLSRAPRPTPHPPIRTPEQQIALLMLQERLALE